jgi:hypothetical protein
MIPTSKLIRTIYVSGPLLWAERQCGKGAIWVCSMRQSDMRLVCDKTRGVMVFASNYSVNLPSPAVY